MVIDAITYNDEKELFDLRYNILKNYVSYFVVVEANQTFSGNPKPYYFEEVIEKYSKVRYLQVGDYPSDTILNGLAWNSETVPVGQTHWHREFYQKECIKKALAKLGCKDEDICFIGDCDEIWHPQLLKMDFNFDSVYKLKQLVYSYYLNQRTSEDWAGTYMTSYKTIKNNVLNHLRTKYPWILIQNGGWHFTNMGGAEKIKYKLESYGHQEFNTQQIKDSLQQKIDQNKDFIGRDYRMWLEEEMWPVYLKENKEKYKHLLKSLT